MQVQVAFRKDAYLRQSLVALGMFLLVMVSNNLLFAQEKNDKRYRISGKVYDAETKETLVSASIRNSNKTSEGRVTDETGAFSLIVKEPSLRLLFSCIGYDSLEKEIHLTQDTTLSIYLSPSSHSLSEVIVSSNSFWEQQRKKGIITVPLYKLRDIPPLFGEADILKSLQYLPGVTAVSEGKSDISIRGSNSDQNLILIDGMPMYNSNHVFGLLSTINPESIKNVTLYKSNQPARFGGRAAAIIDIQTKDGNKEKVRGNIGIGNMSARANIEVPIVKSKTSLAFSLRRSFLDLFLPLFFAKEEEKTTFSFHDLNAKFNHRVNERLSFSALWYYSFDRLENNLKSQVKSSSGSEYRWSWRNQGIQFRTDYTLNDKAFLRFLLSNVNYGKNDHTIQRFNSKVGWQQMGLSSTLSVNDYRANLLLTYYPLNNYTLRIGSEFLKQNVNIKNYSLEKDDKKEYSTVQKSDNWTFFLENEFRLGEYLSANIGIRGNLYFFDKGIHNSLSPRISANLDLFDHKLSLRLDYANTRQYIQQVNNNSVFLQSDVWIVASKRHRPINSHQVAGEVVWKPVDKWEISFAPYWKTMSNLLDYKEGVSFLKNLNRLEDKLVIGKGRAYGIELGVNGSIGAITTTTSYTLSKSERIFQDVNEGNWFPANFDYTHNFYVNSSYQFNKHFSFAASWTYRTGGLQTVPLEKVKSAILPDLIRPVGEEYVQIPHRNNYRLPAYHRLDLSATYSFGVSHWGKGLVSLSIYNAYNRMNVYRVFLEQEEVSGDKLRQKFKIMTMFPIIPSLNFKIEF